MQTCLAVSERKNEPENLGVVCNVETKTIHGNTVFYTIDWETGEETPIDASVVIYPYKDLLLLKHCYTGLDGYISIKSCVMFIKASNPTIGITIADFVLQLYGPLGQGFFVCNHKCFDNVDRIKQGVYKAEFGS